MHRDLLVAGCVPKIYVRHLNQGHCCSGWQKNDTPPPVYMGSQKWVPQLLDNTKLDYNHPKNPMFFGGSGDLHQINAAPWGVPHCLVRKAEQKKSRCFGARKTSAWRSFQPGAKLWPGKKVTLVVDDLKKIAQIKTGWWLTYPSEKYEFVNFSRIVPYMKWKTSKSMSNWHMNHGYICIT